MQKAFSCSYESFDGIPDDSQLVSLLGDPDCGPLKVVEESASITVRPWLIPMKLLVPWMVFVGFLITGIMFSMEIASPLFWFFLVFMWFLSIPGVLALCAVVNRVFAKKGDCFKVDLQRRTLELCPVGKTFEASEIIAFTALTRWYWTTKGVLSKTCQTGVLVRASDDRVELYPVVRKLTSNMVLFQDPWADRLASIFKLPVRRTKLSRSESRALNDC